MALVAMAVAGACFSCRPPSPLERAMALVRQRRDADAIALLRDETARHPEDPNVRKLLARLLASEGELEAAREQIAELAKRSAKDDPIPWIELGHAYELAHRFEDALAAYDAAADASPVSPAGPREGGMRSSRWGELEEARPRLEEAVRRGAHDAALWHALGLVRLHLRDYAAAAEAYRAGLRESPGAMENWLGLASVAVATSDFGGALAAYDALLARAPGYAPAHLGRAWALARLGRVGDAREALDRAAALGSDPAAVAKQRARLADRPAPRGDRDDGGSTPPSSNSADP
jgi:tetratricopeptide (TPR) repeat protein